jgi:hypothetical protein
MAGRVVRLTDPVEILLVEQALAMARQLRRVCREAPDGKVLAAAETAALTAGRELTRQALEAELNREAGESVKKGLRSATAPADGAGATAGRGRGRS